MKLNEVFQCKYTTKKTERSKRILVVGCWPLYRRKLTENIEKDIITNCTNKLQFKDQNFCGKHLCKKCEKKEIYLNFNYCISCKCGITKCDKPTESFSKACVEHKCENEVCRNYCNEDSTVKYCINCLCKYSGCHRKKESFDICIFDVIYKRVILLSEKERPEWKYESEDSKNKIFTYYYNKLKLCNEEKICLEHICEKCSKKIMVFGSKFCVHCKCISDSCNNFSENKLKYCKDHKCLQKKCYKERELNKEHCNSIHCACRVQDCSSIRVVNSTMCKEHSKEIIKKANIQTGPDTVEGTKIC